MWLLSFGYRLPISFIGEPEGKCLIGGHSQWHQQAEHHFIRLTLSMKTFAKIDLSTLDHCLFPDEVVVSLCALSYILQAGSSYSLWVQTMVSI